MLLFSYTTTTEDKMARFPISFNAKTGRLYFGELNEVISGSVFDRGHAGRVLRLMDMVVTAEWLPTENGFTSWVALTDPKIMF